MNVKEAYDQWAEQYDTNENKTRDLEAVALKQALHGLSFDRTLEIGCGTGKNTQWLQTISKKVIAVDLSEEMINKARKKIADPRVTFIQANITHSWTFASETVNLVTFSLVLEHIAELHPIFERVVDRLRPDGRIYIGELHPFKQYAGSKARFETPEGTRIVPCFNHHVSDFTNAAAANGLSVEVLQEHFDDDRSNTPRILSILFKKFN